MSVRFRPDLQLPWTCDYSFVPKRKIALKATHRARARSRFGNEPDLLEAGILHRIDHAADALVRRVHVRSEEHTSELQSLMRISYAVFCLKKKKNTHNQLKYYHKT